MKNKAMITKFLAASLAASLLMTACGSPKENKETAAKETEAVTETEAAAMTEAAEETAQETAQTETASGQETEAETKSVSKEGAKQFDMSELYAKLGRPGGDLAEPVKLEKANEIDEEDEARIDRAMRAYTPSSDGLILNDAKVFYYYSQLDEEGQQIYDTMLLSALDPASEENYNLLLTETDPYSEDFYQKMSMAYYAMIYDHPEFFWLYNSCETSMSYASAGTTVGDMYSVYFYLSNPVENYEAQQKAFNDAAAAFLSDIDLTASEEEVAEAIHDKLISTVTYDMDVLNNAHDEYGNLAHTAYGALVENSYGVANYAVCDGYSLAFEYLLQQAGLEATFIAGVAGTDEVSAGGHAWSMVKLNDKWCEVDTTWDDQDGIVEMLTPDIDGYEYYLEALFDESYRDKLDHYLFGISTDSITYYEPDEDYYAYFTLDGEYMINLVNSSVHLRDKNGTAGAIGMVIDMAPIAQ